MFETMNSDWKQVYETQIFLTPDDNRHNSIRVSATPDCVSIITDMRKYVGKKATPLGVGLFLDELHWVLQGLSTNSNGDRRFDFRKVKLEFDGDVNIITVIKTDWSEQKIYLDHNEVCRLLEIEAELKCAVNDAFKYVEQQ